MDKDIDRARLKLSSDVHHDAAMLIVSRPAARMNSLTTWDPLFTGQMRLPPGAAWQRGLAARFAGGVLDLRS